MTSTRNLVLKTLLNRPRVSVVELAEAVDINPISVRHHIGKLLQNGLVDFISERHGVGRPRQVYFLTEKGMEQFPHRNIQLTTRLIDQMKTSMSDISVKQIFKDIGNDINSKAESELIGMTLYERLNFVEKRLTDEGFEATVERTNEEILIHEYNCPFLHVGKKHREICIIDSQIIKNSLATEAKRTNCMLDGDSCCTYVIPIAAIEENIKIQ